MALNSFVINKTSDFLPIIYQILKQKYPKIILLKGDLGAGKTTFVKTFMAQLDPTIIVTSPTFTLMNTYTTDKLTINHFDLYRLSGSEEALDWGFDEFIIDCDFSFIEWAENALDVIPKPYMIINIHHGEYENSRNLSINIVTD